MNKFHQLNPENRNKNVQQFTSLAAESPQAHIFENRRRSSPFFSRSFENDCHTLIIEVSSFLGQHPRNDVFPYLVNSMETQWRIQGRGPGGAPPLFLDQTEARRAENCFWRPPPPYLRVWMTAPPPYLKVWIWLGTGNMNIALLISVMFPPCGNMLIYFSMYATRFRSVMFPYRKRTIKFPSHFCYYISVLSSLSLFMVWHLILLTICVVKTLLVFPDFNRLNMACTPFATLQANVGICSQRYLELLIIRHVFKSKIKSISFDNKCHSFCN